MDKQVTTEIRELTSEELDSVTGGFPGYVISFGIVDMFINVADGSTTGGVWVCGNSGCAQPFGQ